MASRKHRKPSRRTRPPNSMRSPPSVHTTSEPSESFAVQATGDLPTVGISWEGFGAQRAAVTGEPKGAGKSIRELAVQESELTKRRPTVAGLAVQVPEVTGELVRAEPEKIFHRESTPSTRDMAARNRPQNRAVKEDPDEELSMWNQIKKDIEKCSIIQKRADVVSKSIVEIESKMGPSPSIEEIDKLQALYRENVRLAEDEYRLLNEEPADLIKNIGILSALRTASEKEPQRAPQPSKIRKQKTAPKLDMDGAADSPGPSPSMTVSAPRLKGNNTARSGSVASIRDGKEGKKLEEKEVGVKIEEGAEGAKGPSAERAGKFFIGAEVAYKQAKMKEDGSQWIQCIILGVTDVGNKKRYEVQDPEPDESGAPGQIYKAFAAALIAIPPADAILPDYPVGKPVLARYPETTTFYRAEVTGMKKDMCRLKFEDDQNQEMEVDRRFVLDVSSK